MKLTRLFAIGVFAGSLAMASTSVPGIVSATHLAGTSFSTADGVFTRSAPSATNLNGNTGISLNQPQIWFERELSVPNLGGAGGTRVNWLGGTDSYGVNYSVPGSVSSGPSPLSGPSTAFDTTRVLATGTRVNSYYLYSNRNNASGGDSVYAAQVVFRLPILGIIVTNNSPSSLYLNATNTDYGRPSVTNYNTNSGSGFDNTNQDRLLVEDLGPGLGYRLSFKLSGNGFDNIRILTATPEPATWAAFGLIAITLVIGARRRRAAAPTA